MKAIFFLKGERDREPICIVENLEVCPRGDYIIDGTAYSLTGTPQFNIEDGMLRSVTLIVECLDR